MRVVIDKGASQQARDRLCLPDHGFPNTLTRPSGGHFRSAHPGTFDERNHRDVQLTASWPSLTRRRSPFPPSFEFKFCQTDEGAGAGGSGALRTVEFRAAAGAMTASSRRSIFCSPAHTAIR